MPLPFYFQNEGRALSFAAFYAVAEARVAFRQKEGARRSGYVDRKWSVAPRRQLLHGHPYQLFHTWPCGKRACVRVAKYSVLSRVHTRIWKIIKVISRDKFLLKVSKRRVIYSFNFWKDLFGYSFFFFLNDLRNLDPSSYAIQPETYAILLNRKQRSNCITTLDAIELSIMTRCCRQYRIIGITHAYITKISESLFHLLNPPLVNFQNWHDKYLYRFARTHTQDRYFVETSFPES